LLRASPSILRVMTKTDSQIPAFARLAVADAALAEALRAALAPVSAGPLLAIDAADAAAEAEGEATMPSARALTAAQDFAREAARAQAPDACVVLVAGAQGPDRDALQGCVRALARKLAPVRVNALAPARAGAALDPAQAGAALAYLAQAAVVTGQVLEIGAPDASAPAP
jgi:hypothetical protein